MKDLARYSYCFKFFEAGTPFKAIPVSIALTPLGHNGPEFHALLKEGLDQARAQPEYIPPQAVEALEASCPYVIDRQQAATRLLRHIDAADEVQIWSMHDTHCRHFFAEIFGGMDQNNGFQQFRDKGINKLLPRDMNHIYYGLGKPPLPPKPAGHEWNALETARWQGEIFDTLRGLALNNEVRIAPTDVTPPGHSRIFFDWEYYRESPFVLWPLSIGAVSQDGKNALHLAISEGLDAFANSPKKGTAHYEWIKTNVMPKLQGVETVSAEEAATRILHMAGKNNVLELWSDEDNHDSHLMGSLGAGDKSLYRLARETGAAQQILFRDTRHLRLGMGWPNLPTRAPGRIHNALEDAGYCRYVFNHINALAERQEISPETILPADFRSERSFSPTLPGLSLLHP